MINFNKTATLKFVELYFDIKVSKSKEHLLFQRIKDVVVLQLEKFKKETNSIKEQYDLMNKYFSFNITDKINIYTISEDFFVDIFHLNLINPDWYILSKHPIKEREFISAALYKAGIDLTNNKYRLKEFASLFNLRSVVIRYKKEDKGIRKSLLYTYFSVYLKKITEEEIIEVLKKIKSSTRKDSLNEDISFEYLKRS